MTCAGVAVAGMASMARRGRIREYWAREGIVLVAVTDTSRDCLEPVLYLLTTTVLALMRCKSEMYVCAVPIA